MGKRLGRPPMYPAGHHAMSLSLPSDVWDEIDLECARWGKTRTQVLLEALAGLGFKSATANHQVHVAREGARL